MIGKGKNAFLCGVCEYVFSRNQNGRTHFGVVSAGGAKGECTIERVALVMNIVPCRDLDLNGREEIQPLFGSLV